MTIGDDGMASRCMGKTHDCGKDGVCRDCGAYDWTLDEVRAPLLREGHALYKSLAPKMQEIFGRPIYADDQLLIALALQQRTWFDGSALAKVPPFGGAAARAAKDRIRAILPIQPMPDGALPIYYKDPDDEIDAKG